MTTTTLRHIDLGDAALEVTLGTAPLLIGAAHPAEAFGPATVALLEETAAAGTVTLDPRGVGSSSPRPAGHGLEP